MGGQVNSTAIDTKMIVTAINKVVTNNMTSCGGGDTVISNTIKVTGDNNTVSGIIAQQRNKQSMKCFSTTANQVKLSQDIGQAIAQASATAASSIIGLAVNKTSVKAEVVTNAIQENLTNNVNECNKGSNYTVEQGISIEGNFNNVLNSVLTQDTESVVECMFSADNIADLAQKIEQSSKQQSKTETSLLGNGFSRIAIIAIIVFGLVAIFTRVAFSGRKNKQNNNNGNSRRSRN